MSERPGTGPAAAATGGGAVEGRLPLRLRRMRRGDLEAVHEIERASFATPWSQGTFRSLLRRRNAHMLVAEGALESGEPRVLGHAVIWFVGDEAELGDLAVHPEARGRGVGRALLSAALEAAGRRGARGVFLEVRASNERARSLYEKQGFEPIGRRPGYYQKPREDALVMRRMLD